MNDKPHGVAPYWLKGFQNINPEYLNVRERYGNYKLNFYSLFEVSIFYLLEGAVFSEGRRHWLFETGLRCHKHDKEVYRSLKKSKQTVDRYN